MKDLINVFQDTFQHSVDMLDSITTKHTFNDILTPEKKKGNTNNIFVFNSDSVTQLSHNSKHGKTCVLNMASYRRAGGGVVKGSRAQEECLFRSSNLTHVVKQDNYPLMENECLYTKDAIFFKDVRYDYMDNVVSDVITIAAINLNDNATDKSQKDLDYYNITKSKIRLMLSLAIKNDVDNIVLGAFGCGVFKNDPSVMSNLFHEILIKEGYSNYFKQIVFAIINDHNSVGNNHDIFYDTFKQPKHLGLFL